MSAGNRHLGPVAVCCLLALGLLAPACDTQGEVGDDSGKGTGAASPSGAPLPKKVSIAVFKGMPGFSTRSGSEYVYAGFDIALSDYLATRMGFRKYLHDVPANQRQPELVDGISDLAIAAYTITDERDDEKIDFTAPYFKTYQGVLVREDETDIEQVGDLDGKRVCSAEGTTSDPNAAQKAKDQRRLRTALGADASIGLRRDYKTCVKELQRGNFDAVWTDEILLQGFAETPPYNDEVKLVDGITIENRQFYGVGIAEGHERDCKRMNEALRKFLADSWRETFRDHFPDLADREPDFEQKYKPTDSEFEALEEKSCGAR
jgi:glutamate transport system substrate-binding protein